MSDEYTPTTADVQVYFAVGRYEENRSEGQAEFRRWLVQYTAYVMRCASQYAPETIDGAGQWAWLLELAKDIEENGLKPWMKD